MLLVMAGKKRKEVTEAKITGLKYFDRLLPLFAPLPEVGCQRDKAGNRPLHMDQYCSLILLFLFNPIVTSLRGLQQASELNKVQRKLGCQGPVWDRFRKPPRFSSRSGSKRLSNNC